MRVRCEERELLLAIPDLHGVVLDKHSLIENAYKAAKRAGLSLLRLWVYICFLKLGKRQARSNLEESFEEVWPGTSHEKKDRFIRCFREEMIRNPCRLIEGSAETIYWLRRRNVEVVFCSGGERELLEYNLDFVGLDPRSFPLVTVEDGVKPDPRLLERVFQMVSVPPENSIYFGDTPSDLKLVRGWPTLFFPVLSGFTPRRVFLQNGVPENRILNRFSDIRALIEY